MILEITHHVLTRDKLVIIVFFKKDCLHESESLRANDRIHAMELFPAGMIVVICIRIH
jgi:hypothetical protein